MPYEPGHCGMIWVSAKKKKGSTSTCLLEEVTSCEYGLGMRKCWCCARFVHEEDHNNACAKESVQLI